MNGFLEAALIIYLICCAPCWLKPPGKKALFLGLILDYADRTRNRKLKGKEINWPKNQDEHAEQ